MLGDTWLWNGATWRRTTGASPPARYAHAMAFDSRRGVVVMYGGATMTADRVEVGEHAGVGELGGRPRARGGWQERTVLPPVTRNLPSGVHVAP